MNPNLVPPAAGHIPPARALNKPLKLTSLRRLLLPAAMLAIALPARADIAPQMFGVNLSGGEANAGILPGVLNTNYVYPLETELQYYKDRNLHLVRLPILWERIQNPLNSALIESEMARIDQVIGYARARGMKVILDVHNYNSYKIGGTKYQVGSPQVPYTAFADLWRRLADRYKNEQAIHGYDLMNEPAGTLANWQAAAQAATNAIRTVDTRHWVIVEGVNWAGAQTWRTSNNTLNVTDSSGRLIYSAHSYWSPNHDDGYSAYTSPRDYPLMGLDHLEPFVEWIKEHGYNGFIGEYGVPTTPAVSSAEAALWNPVLDNALAYLEDHGLSGTYWTGGRWMSNYILGCQPASLTNPQDKSVMPILRSHPGELIFEAEAITTVASTDPVTVFADPAASYGAGEKLAANAVNDYINYMVPVPVAGTYTVKVGVKRYSTARGRFTTTIDGVAQGGTFDQHGSSAFVEFNIGSKVFATGDKNFRFTVAGTSSGGYELAFDYIKLDPVPPTLVQVTVDDTSATLTGTWTSAATTEGFFNIGYLHDGNTGKGTKTARFTPNLPSAGNYRVYGKWVGTGTSRAAAVPVGILHAGVTSNTTVNQQVGGGSWVLIGTYNFSAGTGGHVELKTQGTSGFVIADAIRFVRE